MTVPPARPSLRALVALAPIMLGAGPLAAQGVPTRSDTLVTARRATTGGVTVTRARGGASITAPPAGQ